MKPQLEIRAYIFRIIKWYLWILSFVQVIQGNWTSWRLFTSLRGQNQTELNQSPFATTPRLLGYLWIFSFSAVTFWWNTSVDWSWWYLSISPCLLFQISCRLLSFFLLRFPSFFYIFFFCNECSSLVQGPVRFVSWSPSSLSPTLEMCLNVSGWGLRMSASVTDGLLEWYRRGTRALVCCACWKTVIHCSRGRLDLWHW